MKRSLGDLQLQVDMVMNKQIMQLVREDEERRKEEAKNEPKRKFVRLESRAPQIEKKSSIKRKSTKTEKRGVFQKKRTFGDPAKRGGEDSPAASFTREHDAIMEEEE